MLENGNDVITYTQRVLRNCNYIMRHLRTMLLHNNKLLHSRSIHKEKRIMNIRSETIIVEYEHLQLIERTMKWRINEAKEERITKNKETNQLLSYSSEETDRTPLNDASILHQPRTLNDLCYAAWMPRHARQEFISLIYFRKKIMVHTEAIISIFNSSDTNVIRIKKKKKRMRTIFQEFSRMWRYDWKKI